MGEEAGDAFVELHALGTVGSVGRDGALRALRGNGAGTVGEEESDEGLEGEEVVRLRLESPAVLARGDRYILRAYSPPMTIAGGVILDPSPPRTAPCSTSHQGERQDRMWPTGSGGLGGTAGAGRAL